MVALRKREVLIAQFPEEVMCWLETHSNHIMNGENPKYMIFKGTLHELRIPAMLYARCEKYIKPSFKYDNRHWRWDFEAMAKDIKQINSALGIK